MAFFTLWQLTCLLFLSVLWITNVSSHLSGAPAEACSTLSPNQSVHGAPPQTTDVPYILNLSALYNATTDRIVYMPNSVYNSKITANIDVLE